MTTEIYVAGGYKHRMAIRAFVDTIESTGLYKQPRRWFDVEETDETHAQSATADMDAVRSAELVVAVIDDPDYAYRGTWTEVGAAVALNKRVVIIGPRTTASARNVFWHHPAITHVESTAVFVHTAMIDAVRQ